MRAGPEGMNRNLHFHFPSLSGSIPQATLGADCPQKRHPRVVLTIFTTRKVIRSASLVAEPVANAPCDPAWLADRDLFWRIVIFGGSSYFWVRDTEKKQWQAQGCLTGTQILQGQSRCQSGASSVCPEFNVIPTAKVENE